MDLKELIKKLVRKELEEDGSTSSGAGPYSTPYAFSKKGQNTNAATKEAEKLGWTKAKKPKTSKIVDYKKLWKESDYDKPSISSQASGYTAASGYTGPSIKGDDYYKKENMNSIKDIIREELLKEGTYKQFKSEIRYRTKAEQLHKAIREVKRKLSEIDRIVEFTTRMKQELSEGDGVKYLSRTEQAVAQISEMVSHLNNKINHLKQ